MLYNQEGFKKVIAIVPARAGSRRLTGKNYKSFCGKPLVAWSIELAKQCKEIDQIYISTDDPKVIEIGESYGCDIHRREPKDTLDHVNLMQVIPDFIKEDCLILLLQPTSPLRILEDIETAFVQYRPGFSVISVTKLNPYTLMLNGAVYLTHISILDKYRDFYNPVYFAMPKDRSVDIDTQEDWDIAEMIAETKNARHGCGHF